MALTVVAKAKNTTEITAKTTQLASNKNTNNTSGLTAGVQAVNTTEIARIATALASNYNSAN